jgi:predicted dehydrogenase
VTTAVASPRLGFLGVGWIGRHRMKAVLGAGVAQAAAIADLDPALREQAAADAPDAQLAGSLEELLELDLDGIVIATPSALHADQAVAALESGKAVFCQKPLGRTAPETRKVLDAARAADRLLGVDLSYRHVAALRSARELIASGSLGRVYALDLVFHNAYGPDKPWFTQRALSGGGCMIDLGTHLLDLALWLTGSGRAHVEAARTFREGRAVAAGTDEVEDYAVVQLSLPDGVTARLACSWFLPAGRDCDFECTAYGTEGAVSVKNVGGSFYDFRAERFHGTRAELLVEPPDEWGGRAIAAWADRLGRDARYDPAADELLGLATAIDEVYWTAGG